MTRIWIREACVHACTHAYVHKCIDSDVRGSHPFTDAPARIRAYTYSLMRSSMPAAQHSPSACAQNEPMLAKTTFFVIRSVSPGILARHLCKKPSMFDSAHETMSLDAAPVTAVMLTLASRPTNRRCASRFVRAVHFRFMRAAYPLRYCRRRSFLSGEPFASIHKRMPNAICVRVLFMMNTRFGLGPRGAWGLRLTFTFC